VLLLKHPLAIFGDLKYLLQQRFYVLGPRRQVVESVDDGESGSVDGGGSREHLQVG